MAGVGHTRAESILGDEILIGHKDGRRWATNREGITTTNFYSFSKSIFLNACPTTTTECKGEGG